MCGIVGYVGFKNATDVLIEGLRRLEYRGYDSAGIAVKTEAGLKALKRAGKLAVLEEALQKTPLSGPLGIGHTRWATHGPPTDENAHPHRSGKLALVHNGIIENYLELKEELLKKGYTFTSDTDTEVLAHLIADHYQGDLEAAVRAALKRAEGAYAVVVLHEDHDALIAARTVSPLVVGLGEGENFVASDVPALLPFTRRVIYLEDGEMAVVTADGVRVSDLSGTPKTPEVHTIEWTLEQAEKGGFPHYMKKEIFEQPWALENTLGGRIHEESGEVRLDLKLDLSRFEKIHVVAAGTAFYAGWVGKYLIEKLARIPVEADVASEYRYRDPLADEKTLFIAVSQSGETIDTLEALREARQKGATTLGVINVKGSTITREADDTLYIHAGPEIGVASTKVYTAMVAALFLLAVHLGRLRGTLSEAEAKRLLHEAKKLPRLAEKTLERADDYARVAAKYHQATDFLFLGRNLHAPTAYEGALKLKEISYIHAEAYPAGEMKHGPIALIDERLPVVVINPEGPWYEKTKSNVQEVKARGGKVIAVISDGDEAMAAEADEAMFIPPAEPLLSPVLAAIPLQILAYETAVLLGHDPDKPRNLAKSVTVE